MNNEKVITVTVNMSSDLLVPKTAHEDVARFFNEGLAKMTDEDKKGLNKLIEIWRNDASFRKDIITEIRKSFDGVAR